MKMETVWIQNLKGFVKGTFPADERWKKIFIERLDAVDADIQNLKETEDWLRLIIKDLQDERVALLASIDLQPVPDPGHCPIARPSHD